MKKLFSSFFAALLVTAFFFSSFAAALDVQAQASSPQKSYVALGDSISYGYNLGPNNDKPSLLAFPYLLGGSANLKVTNFGVPGMTSGELLTALQTDSKYISSLQKADYVTMNIGNNDLLGALSAAKEADGTVDPVKLQQALGTVLPTMISNIKNSILEVRKYTNAPIAVYNIYNPAQVSDPMHTQFTTLLTTVVNPNIATLVSALAPYNVTLANAYNAFGENQKLFVRPNDIHPTVLGHIILASIGFSALHLN
ncbi:SGNH/GDSL hydrolase family protein [Paenibacillus xylaniclasticus]|uniref:SGNH/GDSL hydrolase family protein n=1 Tax=Paenibacillus xylaniclasticus TaxID=588083 RepID=UPI000FDAA8B3|nr:MULTISPECIES: SGNH/GDSL hydrolase family protein [Paenibacillus]GFN31167.1 lipase [Paenibacillus curdlanolyticus]